MPITLANRSDLKSGLHSQEEFEVKVRFSGADVVWKLRGIGLSQMEYDFRRASNAYGSFRRNRDVTNPFVYELSGLDHRGNSIEVVISGNNLRTANRLDEEDVFVPVKLISRKVTVAKRK